MGLAGITEAAGHAAVAHPVLALGAAAAIAFAGYLVSLLVSLRLHPYTECGKCAGDGKVRGLIFQRALNRCSRCRGRGMVPRLGTVLLAGLGTGIAKGRA